MNAQAKSRYIRVSPTKLRPLADVVRGWDVEKALAWLKTTPMRRVVPLEKVIFSAYSNAKCAENNIEMRELRIKKITVDQGPTHRYFKAGAMGRAQVQRKRMSHVEVILEKQAT